MSDKKPVRVVIAGGGTAGWMMAAAIARTMGKTVDLTLVESEAIGTIGVGESTIPPLVNFNRILGIPEEESRELLDFLFEHSVRQEGVWMQDWQVGDILVWDNRCTMHRQTDYDPSERRMLKRATVMEVFPGI